jgi:hypothetical protein
MWIMVAGPYKSGAQTAEERHSNLTEMNKVAYEIFRRGHVPIIGVNLALPIIEATGQDVYSEVMMPVSLAAAERCDAIIRIGGGSTGADDEVATVVGHGGRVFLSIDDIPQVKP